MKLRASYWIGVLACLMASAGCGLLPDRVYVPTVHNPFPQLSRVAVAPFFNQSTEHSLDGRDVAIAYYNELQAVQGFDVIPVGVVETEMRTRHLQLRSPEEARHLAQILGADALVIGAVTDFTPYYPPRCGLQVEWYAANPGFHPIPPGYGLPWGTQEEKDIPGPLVLEAEFALAKQQLSTQSPAFQPAPDAAAGNGASKDGTAAKATQTKHAQDSATPAGQPANASDGTAYWPDPRGFVPPPPSGKPPPPWPTLQPVLRHTKIYHGNDADFTAALESYYNSRDEARFDGWQGYLQRSDDFVRFCCHMHIWEMLTARGGAGESRVVWRWPEIR